MVHTWSHLSYTRYGNKFVSVLCGNCVEDRTEVRLMEASTLNQDHGNDDVVEERNHHNDTYVDDALENQTADCMENMQWTCRGCNEGML